jgi:ComF family protein
MSHAPPTESRRLAAPDVRRGTARLAAIIQPLLSVLLPTSCAVCGTVEDDAAPLCSACDEKLANLQSQPACEYCAKPLIAGSACGWCAGKGLPHFNRILRLAIYEDPLRTLVRQMKYHHRWPFAGYLAGRLAQQSAVRELVETIDCIVPVPMHWRRQIMRGYNSADLLASRIGKEFRKPVIRTARRVRNTPTQTNLSPTARAENMRGAFAIRKPGLLKDKRVLIVDDVLTTGSTIQHLARVLIKAEVKSLDALVIAVADPRHADFEVR